jgi:hypothetical protein
MGKKMAMIDKNKKEMAAYQAGPFDDLKVQEALTIIAVYAARMDYKNCEADVRRLAEIFERHPMFVARKKEIFSMINKYVNSMEAGDPHKALDKAVEALTQDQKDAAFELAVEVAEPDKQLTADEEKMFAALKARLSISDEFAAQALAR